MTHGDAVAVTSAGCCDGRRLAGRSASTNGRSAARPPGSRPLPRETARVEAVRRRLLRSRQHRGREQERRWRLLRRLQGPDAVDRRYRRERRGLRRRLLGGCRRERRRPRAARAALALPEGRRRLRRPARRHVLRPVAHRAAAARRDPRPRHALPRRLAARPRQLLELRRAGPARAAHGQDAARASRRSPCRGRRSRRRPRPARRSWRRWPRCAKAARQCLDPEQRCSGATTGPIA